MRNTRRTSYLPLKGGEDLVTPVFSKPPGTLSASKNFECDSGGRYRRIDGYERFDGNSSPAAATYWTLSFTAGATAVAVGATVTDATSGATGEVIVAATITSGTYAGGDAAGVLILGSVDGVFADGNNLQVSASTIAVAADTANLNYAESDVYDTYLQAAIEALRDKIAAVPGSGNVLGVTSLNYVKYAFRANAGGTAVDIYKSSAAGWVKVTIDQIIYFDAGTTAFVVGETLAGAAGSSTIKRLVVQTGDWSTNDAAGYMIITASTSPFVDNETITSASGSADAAGINTAITLATGGKYEFRVSNFYGHSSTKRIYGCDGKNNGFEFDGSTYVPIFTGMTTDTPTHLEVVKGYLFFTFAGGSLQLSSVGVPVEWSAITGAAEIGLGDEIVGLELMVGDTLAVIGNTKISILYESSGSWELKSFSRKYGGREWSIQRGTDIYFLDSSGLTALSSVDAFGDFESSPITAPIKPLISAKMNTFETSISVRDKEQLRYFYSDKTGINMTFDGNTPIGFTQLEYLHAVKCTCEAIDADGKDELFFGSDDGFVYQLDKGTSFDGAAVEAFIRTWVITLRNPEKKKRFFKLVLERDDITTEGYWDVGKWGLFNWDLQGLVLPHEYLDFAGGGYAYGHYSKLIYDAPYTLQGAILHYSDGGLNR